MAGLRPWASDLLPARRRDSRSCSRRPAALVLVLLFAALGPATAAARSPDAAPPLDADVDADFARAADLLEAGQRVEAEQILDGIRTRASQPAWDARVAFLLAGDDLRRKDYAVAAARLETPASSIGLEAYRELLRADALERAGDRDAAAGAADRAFRADGPFAYRVRAGLMVARLLEQKGDVRGAAAALALASESTSSPAETAEIAVARIRLGIAMHDRKTVDEAARAMLLGAPRADADRSLPVYVRAAAADAERGMTPADRGRRGSALVAAGDPKRGFAFSAEPPVGVARGRALPEPPRARARRARAQEGEGRRGDGRARSRRRDGRGGGGEAPPLRSRSRASAQSRRARPPPPADLEPVVQSLEVLTVPAVPESVRRGADERLLRIAAECGRFRRGARACARDHRGLAGVDGRLRAALEAGLGAVLAGGLPGGARALRGPGRAVRRRRAVPPPRVLAGQVPGRRGAARRGARDLRRARAARGHRPLRAVRAAPRGELLAASSRRPLGRSLDGDRGLRPRRRAAAAAALRGGGRPRRGALPPSRGRDLRLAQAEFALGRFAPAAAGDQARAPGDRHGRGGARAGRLAAPLLPDRGGQRSRRAREGVRPRTRRCCAASCGRRASSIRDAKSRAGAVGLTQLMPATAKSLSRSVLRTRYRGAFLYDPGVNAALGAAYLQAPRRRSSTASTVLGAGGLQRRSRRGSPGSPARTRGLAEDELFESHPPLRDAGLRAAGAAVCRVVQGAVSLESDRRVSAEDPPGHDEDRVPICRRPAVTGASPLRARGGRADDDEIVGPLAELGEDALRSVPPPPAPRRPRRLRARAASRRRARGACARGAAACGRGA